MSCARRCAAGSGHGSSYGLTATMRRWWNRDWPPRFLPGGPGRGMIAQNYDRAGEEPVGLHTLMGRPALEDTGGDGVRFPQCC